MIIEVYLVPNKTFADVREVLDNDALNPLSRRQPRVSG